jgi:hypothetical protein
MCIIQLDYLVHKGNRWLTKRLDQTNNFYQKKLSTYTQNPSSQFKIKIVNYWLCMDIHIQQ